MATLPFVDEHSFSHAQGNRNSALASLPCGDDYEDEGGGGGWREHNLGLVETHIFLDPQESRSPFYQNRYFLKNTY